MRRRYLIVWAFGIVIIAFGRILGLYFFEQAQPRFNASRLGEPGQLEALVREFTLPGRLPVDVLLLWSFLVLLWWLRDQVRFSPALSSKSRQFDYLLLWVVGGIIVVNWGLWILTNITSLEGNAPTQPGSLTATFEDDSSFSNAGAAATDPSPTLSASDDLSATVALVAAWSAVTIIVLLLVGDGVKGGFYETSLAPYRAVLLTLTVVILLTLLANVFAFVGIQSRVRSLDAPVGLLNQTVTALAANAENLSTFASQYEVDVASKVWERAEGERRQQVLEDLFNRGTAMAQRARETSTLAFAAVSQVEAAVAMEQAALKNAKLDPAQAELPAIQLVLQEAEESASSLIGDAGTIEYKLLPYLRPRNDEPGQEGGEFIPLRLQTDIRDIENHALTTSLRATAASEALNGLESRGTSLFLWLAAFYSSFVLFPWILLLMFFYRKREFRAVEIIADLTRLDPTKTMLQRALGTSLTSKQLSARAVEQLLDRAFGNREYVLSSLLLTTLTAAGWYYFLYPRADIGISELVRSGAGITQLTTDLAAHASPLTMGFAGAYFFVAQMLLRRYLAGDLYPSAFLQGSVRIIWVFTLSVALSVLLPDGNAWMKFGAIIAFVAGIFPREGFRVISAAASGFVAKLLRPALPTMAFPTDTEATPLTNLDGVNIWVESRLLEENVENVQGMATAPIERLVVGTYYPASRIVDWVDQAILLTHCGDGQKWCPRLQAVGIRTATDLLDAASPGRPATSCPDDLAFDPADDELVMLERAVAEATPTGKDDMPPLTATILSEMCKVIWPDPNLRYVQRYRVSTNVEAKASETVPREVNGAATPNGKNGVMKDEIVSEVIGVTDERPPHDNNSHSS